MPVALHEPSLGHLKAEAELSCTERHAEQIVSSRFETFERCLVLLLSRKLQNIPVRPRQLIPNMAAEFQTARSRRCRSDDHQIHWQGLERSPSGLHVACDHKLVAARADSRLYEGSDSGAVVDNQDVLDAHLAP
jgi:hypothetical protein